MENILDIVDGSPVDFEILYISKLPKFNILTNRFNNYNNYTYYSNYGKNISNGTYKST